MSNKKINNISPKKRVLLAPLDWGLGHATRCIPIIKELLLNGCEVIIAAEKQVKAILEHEFQQLTFIPLRGYRIRYSQQGRWLPVKLAVQIPGILVNVYREHQWLKKVVKKFAINAIISDNRFGLYHRTVPAVYMTHQLLIKTGNAFSEKLLQRLHYRYIRKYTHCWVPDFEGTVNIAGQLSHPNRRPRNVTYIGGLSRFEREPATKRYDLLLLLSGPEPQRSIFETSLRRQLKTFTGRSLLVRGLPGATGDQATSTIAAAADLNLTTVNHLSAAELNTALQQASMVICRSGYTSVMDLLKLGQTAILVPTPGQTEQEYLARHLQEQELFYACNQEDFALSEALQRAAAFPFRKAAFDMEQYKKVVAAFVLSLS